jgi:hypothetical protein
LVKSFRATQPFFGCARAAVEDQRYEDGNVQEDDEDVVVVVVRLVVDVVRLVVEVVVRLVVEVLPPVVVRVVVDVVPPPPELPSAVQLTATEEALPLPVNPNDVEAPAPSAPLYAALRTETVPEVPVFVPFQRDWMDAPDGRVSVTVQPVMALLPAVTVTLAWNPPGQGVPAA